MRGRPKQQRRVDGDHPVGALDQIGVDEQPGLAGTVGVHDRSHASSLGTVSPGANTDPV